MKVDANLIVELRLERSWSQEEFAIACGLNRRTIQRIESAGTASLQSIKAICAAFELDIGDVRVEELKPMRKFEYKAVEMPFKFGVFKQRTPDIESVLNRGGDRGWRLHQVVVPASSNFGQSENMIAILEREKLPDSAA